MQDDEAVREFLIESNENLAKLDRELVELEQKPGDTNLIASIFRTIHTIKGTSGFFGFSILGSITHIAENILSQVRDKQRELTPEIVSLILETVDAVKAVLTAIESNGAEGQDVYQELRERLTAVHKACGSLASAPAVKASTGSQPINKDSVAPQSPVPSPPTPASHPAPEVSPSTAETLHNEGVHKEKEQEVVASAVRTSTISDSTIRVDVTLLDKLMNLVGELVLARNQILQVSASQDSAFTTTSQRLNLITTELQESVMKTRMQPIGVVWDKLPRVVRDLAASCGKKIQIEMDGAETELDKTIIEAIKDPLTHIVRNSCDHGIEMPQLRVQKGKSPQGRLALRAFHEGGHVIIEIADDGAGIDAEKIKAKALSKGLIRAEQLTHLSEREGLNLIFLPALSTAETVTSISGRGVGMDVVKTNVEKIGGSVDLSSTLGEGTTIRIKIPLTLAIIPGLVVTLRAPDGDSAAEERFVIPQASLLELIRLEGEQARSQIENVHGTPVYRRRGKLLPLVYLNRVLQVVEEIQHADIVNIVVLQAENHQFGLVVDGISDTQEIVVKPLGKQLKGLNCYAGASIMGDGRIALILDVLGLAQRAGVINEIRDRSMAEQSEESKKSTTEKKTFLVFAGPSDCRMAVPLDRVARLEELPVSQVEQAGTQWVAQYRGEILPLVDLGLAVEEKRERMRVRDVFSEASNSTRLQVVVCNQDGHRVGLMVERIVDIVEDAAELKYPASRPGILYSAVINGQVTELIDIPSILQSTGVSFMQQPQGEMNLAKAAN
jgi:two-component system chemotaxis sensor kinase CheA